MYKVKSLTLLADDSTELLLELLESRREREEDNEERVERSPDEIKCILMKCDEKTVKKSDD